MLDQTAPARSTHRIEPPARPLARIAPRLSMMQCSAVRPTPEIPPEMTETQRVTFAAGSGLLDRATHLRDMAEDLLHHRRAALLPLFQGQV